MSHRVIMEPQMMLLLMQSLHICAGTFVVDVSQEHYQVWEDDNITLEWSFTRDSDSVRHVICDVLGNHSDVKTLYYLHRDEEQPDSQHQQFSGRVQCERNGLSEGRVKLHLSKVTLGDAGTYMCEVHAGRHADFARCEVNVIAATGRPKAQATTLRPRPDSEGRVTVIITVTFVSITLVALASVGGAVACFALRWKIRRSMKESQRGSSVPEKTARSDSDSFKSLPLLSSLLQT